MRKLCQRHAGSARESVDNIHRRRLPGTLQIGQVCPMQPGPIGKIFFGLDASSTRSWMYLVTIALVPPIVLLSLWPGPRAQTIADVTRGTDGGA